MKLLAQCVVCTLVFGLAAWSLGGALAGEKQVKVGDKAPALQSKDENGKGMYDYQRSLSTSQGTGSTLKYTFSGTGLDVLGPNDGTAKLQVTVDGQVVNASAATLASKERFVGSILHQGMLEGVNRIRRCSALVDKSAVD